MPHPYVPILPVLDDPANDTQFAAFVAKYVVSASVKAMLARALDSTSADVTQWAAGTNLPALDMRLFVVRWIQGCPAAR